MAGIPFLRPKVISHVHYLDFLSQMEDSRLYSNYGPLNSLFEDRVVNEVFEHTGAVVTVNNATSGLMLAISQCKRPQARYALMPSFTFAATPLAALWCGLEPYFVDISQDDWCMNENLLDELIESLGEQVAVVVPYATFGTYMDLTYYQKLHDAGIPVVVDAAASFGTIGENGHFGKGFTGNIVFSFHATKAFGIGEGGLVYSGNQQSIQHIRQAGNFGFSNSRESIFQGMNSKISEFTAAVALATLDEYPQKKAARQQIYGLYLQHFTRLKMFEEGWVVQESEGSIPHQFFSVLCPEDELNINIAEWLASHQIESRTYFSPACHQHRLFSCYSSKTLQVTERICERILSLPLWEEMKEDDVEMITERLRAKR